MRYGIFSDVHSNLEALKAVLDYYREEKIDKYICLGDVVGYGANPQEVISIIKKLNSVCIAGNHDWAVGGRFDVDYFNPRAKQAVLWTKKELREADILWLNNLCLEYEESNFICVHGSLVDPGEFHYVYDVNDAWYNFCLLGKQFCFIGHSHKRGVYFIEANDINESESSFCSGCRVLYSQDLIIEIKSSVRYIVNVGSVGQPRDRDPRASVCIYDTDEKTLFFKRVEYDIKAAANKILQRGLPSVFGLRLYSGW